MRRVSSQLVGAAALFVALSFSAALAGPQQEGTSPGGSPSAGPDLDAGESGGAKGPVGGRPDQSGNPPEQSGQMSPPEDKPDAKGKAAEQAVSPEGKAAKGSDNAEVQGNTDRPDEGKAGKSAESGREGGLSGEGKAGTTADRKDDEGKAGKSTRLESKDVSRVKTHFSQHKPTAQRIDRDRVSVSIGIAIPGAIALYDLPPDVIVVTGRCPIKYFVWDDDIVLVDSCTREVVEIIADVA